MKMKLTGDSAVTAQSILTDLEQKLIAAGEQDVAASIIPQLVNIENAPNAAVAIMQGSLILGQLIAALPTFEAQALADIAHSVIALVRLYVPSVPVPAGA